MTDQDLLRSVPSKRIQPVDGMAVTAQVWEEAHDYHRQSQRMHEQLRHRSGIVTGLEVVASEPADSSVYIRPGVAVDPGGQVIILSEPVTYDVRAAYGSLFLVLTYEESQPAPESEAEDSPMYVYAQFGLEVMKELPDTPHVELARVQRLDRGSALVNARDVQRPGPNEIDVRFRRMAGVDAQKSACVAVCYTGGLSDTQDGHGISNVAQAARRLGLQVWVNDRVPISSDLTTYTLVYLVGRDAFQLSRAEMNALYEYLQKGGTMLVESCRHDLAKGDPPADASFLDLFASMGIALRDLERKDTLLREPYLFSAPPPGSEIVAEAKVLVGGGTIWTKHDYGCLWRGEQQGGPASREAIRAAMEWGYNILAYAMARKGGTAGA